VLNGAAGQTRQEMLAALSLSGSSSMQSIRQRAADQSDPHTGQEHHVVSGGFVVVDNRRATLRPDYIKQTKRRTTPK